MDREINVVQQIEEQGFLLEWFDKDTLEYLEKIEFESERVLRGTINKLIFMMKYYEKSKIDVCFAKDILDGKIDIL